MERFLNINDEVVKYHLVNLQQIVFEVTEDCNLNCRYCGLADLYQNKGNPDRKKRNLSFEKGVLLIDYLHYLWKNNHIKGANFPVSISFYGGEPLLNDSLIKELISYVEQLPNTGKHFHYGMTTNAMLLDKHMDYLAEKKFRLLISLDGDELAQSYRVDHGDNNSFGRVFKNIQLLQETHPKYFQQLVQFNSVLHNRNNVETTYRFIMDNFGKAPMISPLNNSGINPEMVEEFRKMYQNTFESMRRSVNCEEIESEMFISTPRVSQLANFIYKETGNVFTDYNDLIFDHSGTGFVPTGTCAPFAKKMFVTADGKILQCERIDHDFVLGYVHDDRVELDFQKIADCHNHHISKFHPQCSSCAFGGKCPQCVYQLDNVREKNPQCWHFYTKDELNAEKEQTIDFLRDHPDYYSRILNDIVIR